MLRAETVAALPAHAETVELSAGDDGAYPRLLAALWASGADWCVVEQDVVVTPTTLTDLDACPFPWCVAPPHGRPGLAWLGAVRFRSALMAEHPDAMREAMSIADDGAPAGSCAACTSRPMTTCPSSTFMPMTSPLVVGRPPLPAP